VLRNFPSTWPHFDITTDSEIPTLQTGVTFADVITGSVLKKTRKPRETQTTKPKPKPGIAPEEEYTISQILSLDLVSPTTAPKNETTEKETKTGEKKNLSIKRTKKAQQTDLDIDLENKPVIVKLPKTTKSQTTTTTKKSEYFFPYLHLQ
jgi:hypothetical protein